MVDHLLEHSPVEHICFAGNDFFIKRDDLLTPAFSGNKARKLYYLLGNEFPGISKVIGHGSPQANLLYSLSALAKLKGWQLDFYVDHIPAFLRDNPAGNYLAAIENGANIISLSGKELSGTVGEYIQDVVLPLSKHCLFVPEGGRSELAEPGVKRLAEEIKSWKQEHQVPDLKVVLPSGTGTTALYLQKYLPFDVLTCACVGGEDYLKKQFFELSIDEKHHPVILPTSKKYHFGKLYDEFFTMWKTLRNDTGIEFELLYDPLGWISLLDYLAGRDKQKNKSTILYIHQGGLLGNSTMLSRYNRKNTFR